MKPVTQTVLHSEDANGNCLRAALASVLEVGIDDLPHIEDWGEDWFAQLRQWMRAYNGQTVNVYHPSVAPAGYSIAAGYSPRGIYHSVVAKDGEPVFDPHPSRAGLVEIERYWVIEKE